MKVIGIRGGSDFGKSKTIEESLERIFKIKLIRPHIQTEVVISFFWNQEKIGICSIGDNLSSMEEYLRQFKDIGCDKVIIAIRDNPSLIERVKAVLEVQQITFIDCLDVGSNEVEQENERNRRINLLRGLI